MTPVPENIDTVKQGKFNFLRTKLPLIFMILGFLVLIGICFSLWFFMFKSRNFKTPSVANIGSKQSIKVTSEPQYFPSTYVGMSTEKTSQGVEVSKIISGGPADKAGLLNGDYIEKLGKTADFSNPSDVDPMSFLNTVQGMQDGESLYFQLKRGDQILNKNVTVQHTTDTPIWFSGDVNHSNFTLVMPEIKLDNIIRGWKIDNVAQNGDGYGFSDPVNNLVKLSVWESYNGYFDHTASAEDVLQSLIPPSIDNYRKSKINTYPAAIYTQTEDDNDELILRVSGNSNGIQMGVQLTVPKNLSSKYQDTFNKIIDSVTVQDMDGTPRT